MTEQTPQPGPQSLTVSETLEHAITCHKAGRLPEAERLYRTILQLQPRHPDANHNLGVLAMGLGRPAAALPFLKVALDANPKSEQYWVTYAKALLAAGETESARQVIAQAEKQSVTSAHLKEVKQNLATRSATSVDGPSSMEEEHVLRLFNEGKYAEAEGLVRAMIRRFPAHGFGWYTLATILIRTGRNADALEPAQRAALLWAHVPEAHNNLAAILKELGRVPEAEASCRRALKIRPDHAEALNNLGVILRELGRLEEAEAVCRRANDLQPGLLAPLLNLGKILQNLGRLPEAGATYRRALAIKPDAAEAQSGLGSVLRTLGRWEEAERWCRQAIQINPALTEAHATLGSVLTFLGRLDEAVASFQTALRINPKYATAHGNLGNALKELGRVEEAVACYRRALELKPRLAKAHSNLLLSLNYLPNIPATEVYAEHRQWEQRHALTVPNRRQEKIDHDRQRKLRVGYLSPDFREHSVAFFFEPLLRAHDHSSVETYCYADVYCPDVVTARLQRLADHWLSTVSLSDEALAGRITEDKIDILVDLAGHTADNRLGVFLHRPAPVQVTWLGYPNTTGLQAMDYRLVDSITDPPGTADELSTEQLVRLPNGFLCYEPPATAPLPEPPPSVRNRFVTFGSFHNTAKLSSATLEVWARVLHRVPNSRLLLKAKPGDEAASRDELLARLGQHGLDCERVTLLGWSNDLENHLARYAQVDIALDTFPYNGTTTTCEALWMGVPVISLAGDRHASRVGASLLTQVGLTDLVTISTEGYVEIAVALAQDSRRLIGLRKSLRERVARSPLCDARGFAGTIEAAYRRMWHDFCDRAQLGK